MSVVAHSEDPFGAVIGPAAPEPEGMSGECAQLSTGAWTFGLERLSDKERNLVSQDHLLQEAHPD